MQIARYQSHYVITDQKGGISQEVTGCDELVIGQEAQVRFTLTARPLPNIFFLGH